jgi:Trk K+ transport system NAD-binding subunit
MKRLLIVGAGSHGSIVAETAELIGYSVVGFIDANPNVKGTSKNRAF